MSDRTPAEIEAEIVRRRERLAVTLDEIGVRVHPKTIKEDARARVVATVDRTAGRAYLAVNQTVNGVRDQLVTPEGSPRMERVVPLALVTLAVAGLYLTSARRRNR